MAKRLLKPTRQHTAKHRAELEELMIQCDAASVALQGIYRAALTAYFGKEDFKALMREARRKPKGTAKTRK